MPRILVIDDDRGVRETVATYLRRIGHEVIEAPNGSRVSAVLRDQAVDLVITDINMPDMDGIEVIDQLRRTADGCPVIAMSGGGLFAKELLLKNAQMLGAVSTLTKPFELDALRDIVDRVLGTARGGQD